MTFNPVALLRRAASTGRFALSAVALVASLLAIAPLAGAQTVLDAAAADSKPRLAPISKGGVSRIAVDGGRILQFVFDDQELVVDKDEGNSQVFVRPKVDRPVSVFVLTEKGTHALVLEPKDVPISTIVIREAHRADSRPVAKSAIERAGSLESSVKRLITVMAKGEASPEFQIVEIAKPIALWAESQFEFVRRFDGRVLVGEHYRLRNVSAAVMRLAEQELFRDGVVAISIELHELAPGASTDVFVVRLANG